MKATVILFCLVAVATACSFGQKAPISTAGNKEAVSGYDPVAYFTDKQPVKGNKAFTYEWQGAKWLFASQAHLETFKAAPEKYAPQFGGYCAWAVSQGYTAPSDPMAWEIVDGKLYLNYNKKVQADWAKDKANLIRKGHANWPKVL